MANQTAPDLDSDVRLLVAVTLNPGVLGRDLRRVVPGVMPETRRRLLKQLRDRGLIRAGGSRRDRRWYPVVVEDAHVEVVDGQ